MELIVKEMTLPEAIEFNFDELKQELSEKVEQYTNLVYSEDQIKEAKADVANLRKFVKALSDERIKVKKQCMKPYEAFEAKVKELESIVNQPITLIDSQVKEYETQCKLAKRNAICEYWNNKNMTGWLQLEQIFDDKWLNASASMKSVQEAIDKRIDQIATDLATLSNLPEFGFEAVEIYKTTLDINKALSEGRRLAEIQKAKQAQMAQAVNPVAEQIEVNGDEGLFDEAEEDDDFVPTFDATEKVKCTYQMKLNKSQKQALEFYLTSQKIMFAEI